MTSKRNLATAVAVFGTVLALSGCGGGGDSSASSSAGGNTTSTSSLSATATASVDAFIAYLKVVISGSSDTSSPVQLGDAVAPTSDTASPVGL